MTIVTNTQADSLDDHFGSEVSVPITVALLGLGLLGMAGIAARKRKLEKTNANVLNSRITLLDMRAGNVILTLDSYFKKKILDLIICSVSVQLIFLMMP